MISHEGKGGRKRDRVVREKYEEIPRVLLERDLLSFSVFLSLCFVLSWNVKGALRRRFREWSGINSDVDG